MEAAVLVPWRPGDAHREAAWAWVKAKYASEHPGWQVIEGSCADGPWCKADAVADALHQSSAGLLIVADADVWADNLTDTLNEVQPGRWAIPHGPVHRLNESSTAAVLDGGPLGGDLAQRPYKGHPGGGIVCLHRTDYERVPLDPRFVGWGQEDDSWGLALKVMLGRPWRGKAPLWHLWHPPQPRQSRVVGSQENAELFYRYRNSRTPEAMAVLLEEVTRWRTSASS